MLFQITMKKKISKYSTKKLCTCSCSNSPRKLDLIKFNNNFIDNAEDFIYKIELEIIYTKRVKEILIGGTMRLETQQILDSIHITNLKKNWTII
jgi:hypothetical protein